jgi:hypothetical protein
LVSRGAEPTPNLYVQLPVLQEIYEAAGPGFEPGLSDSESLVLPLHHPAM